MGLKWVSIFCQQARFAMKTDDDIYVNLPLLHSALTNESKFQIKITGESACFYNFNVYKTIYLFRLHQEWSPDSSSANPNPGSTLPSRIHDESLPRVHSWSRLRHPGKVCQGPVSGLLIDQVLAN